MKEDRIIFRGVEVHVSWPARLAEAQQQKLYLIDQDVFPRIPYGEEADDWGADFAPCHDCAAIKGELHVIGCDVERCPKCGGQAISCDCDDEEDRFAEINSSNGHHPRWS